MTSVMDRYGLFGSNAAHGCGLCRTMEHGIGSGSTVPGCQGRSAGGVMVHRLSVASLDSGAESPVYGEEPSAAAGRTGTEAAHLAPRATVSAHGGAVSPRLTALLQVPHAGSTRYITATTSRIG